MGTSEWIAFFNVMSFVPGVGAPFAVAMALDSIANGDYVGGALGIAGGVLNAIPAAQMVGAVREAAEVGRGLRAATDAADLAEKVGPLGGKLYESGKLRRLETFLGRRGVSVSYDQAAFKDYPNAGALYNRVTNTLHFRGQPTEYEVWHEMAHMLQRREIGLEAYSKLTSLEREQHVFDTLRSSRRWGQLNTAQQSHAAWYIRSKGGRAW